MNCLQDVPPSGPSRRNLILEFYIFPPKKTFQLLFKRMNEERIELDYRRFYFQTIFTMRSLHGFGCAAGDVGGFNYGNDGDGDDDGDGDRIPPPGKDVPRSRENGTARRPPWACASSLYSL